MVSADEIAEFRSRLLTWGQHEDNYREFPWRSTQDLYEVLIAEVLLGATFAEKVEPIYVRLLNQYPNPGSLASADTDALADLLEPLGLQNRKARALQKIGEQLQQGEVPDSEEELMDLPYVGRYAANATLCFSLGRRRPIVDSNVVRIYSRLYAAPENVESKETWKFAEMMLPEENVREFNLALLDFGNAICRPSPRCTECFLTDLCIYYAEEVAE